MHIVKHRAEPISAIILSNDGKRTAMQTIRTITAIRIAAFEASRSTDFIAPCWLDCPSGRGTSPQRTSMVATRGRQLQRVNRKSPSARREKSKLDMLNTYFKGTLVIGIVAINTIMQIDKARGNSFVNRMLAVISSRTVSPNISQPTMAIAQSREYYSETRLLIPKELSIFFPY